MAKRGRKKDSERDLDPSHLRSLIWLLLPAISAYENLLKAGKKPPGELLKLLSGLQNDFYAEFVDTPLLIKTSDEWASRLLEQLTSLFKRYKDRQCSDKEYGSKIDALDKELGLHWPWHNGSTLGLSRDQISNYPSPRAAAKARLGLLIFDAHDPRTVDKMVKINALTNWGAARDANPLDDLKKLLFANGFFTEEAIRNAMAILEKDLQLAINARSRLKND